MAQIVDVSQQARGGTAAIGYSYGVYHQQQAQTWQAFPPQQFYGGYGGQPQAQAYVQDPTQVAAAYQLSGYQGASCNAEAVAACAAVATDTAAPIFRQGTLAAKWVPTAGAVV